MILPLNVKRCLCENYNLELSESVCVIMFHKQKAYFFLCSSLNPYYIGGNVKFGPGLLFSMSVNCLKVKPQRLKIGESHYPDLISEGGELPITFFFHFQWKMKQNVITF